ncbi:RNA 3'-phosphate cyclase [Candidatus Saganbacteria bacterium]|nr:RNA 3'-phosphate cyclase [Candidatus Saganbacteria bacterium]
MIEIDGSIGEGGGQILRTALTLAALTKTPLTIDKIRLGRKKPGLQPQHLTGVRAAAEVCRGKLSGAELFSDHLTFEPGDIKSGFFEFDAAKVSPSAGSVGMILEQLLPILIFGKETSYITIKGGTGVPWSPPAEFIEKVFLPTLSKMGVKASLEIQKLGFYPIGGGSIKSTLTPLASHLSPLGLTSRGILKSLNCLAAVNGLPASIAERENRQAQKRLADLKLEVKCEAKTSSGPSSGNLFLLWAEYENCLAGFSALGELGKPAERVADEAVDEFLKFNAGETAVEKHLADQLMIYAALAKGKSTLKVQEITKHLETNRLVIEQLLPVKFEIAGDLVSVEGIGLEAGK